MALTPEIIQAIKDEIQNQINNIDTATVNDLPLFDATDEADTSETTIEVHNNLRSENEKDRKISLTQLKTLLENL